MKDNRDPQVLGTSLLRQRMEKNFRHLKLSQVADRIFSPSTTHDSEPKDVPYALAENRQSIASNEVQDGGVASKRWSGTIGGMVPYRSESQ